MGLVPDSVWDRYKDIINEFHDDAFQQSITLLRKVTIDDPHGEDTNIRDQELKLLCLVQYNYFRSWPINDVKPSGEHDKESCLVYFNLDFLEKNGLLDGNGNLQFNPAMDRFILEGVTYKAFGDSKAAQAKDQNLFIFIILQREEINTGDDRYLKNE